jgi:hypothetical protein
MRALRVKDTKWEWAMDNDVDILGLQETHCTGYTNLAMETVTVYMVPVGKEENRGTL